MCLLAVCFFWIFGCIPRMLCNLKFEFWIATCLCRLIGTCSYTCKIPSLCIMRTYLGLSSVISRMQDADCCVLLHARRLSPTRESKRWNESNSGIDRMKRFDGLFLEKEFIFLLVFQCEAGDVEWWNREAKKASSRIHETKKFCMRSPILSKKKRGHLFEAYQCTETWVE